MFAATDTAWAPWFVARSEDKQRARLNMISHLLKQVQYKDVPRQKVGLPKRQMRPATYRDPNYPYKLVPKVTKLRGLDARSRMAVDVSDRPGTDPRT